MSDQNVVTDWKAYFAALGPGEPFSAEKLEAMRDKDPKMILIMDANPGGLMARHVLEDEGCFEAAFELWATAGRPQAWLMHGNSSAPWFIAGVVSQVKAKPKRAA